MQPSNEKVAPNQHEYDREKGYVEKPYEHQEYPKHVNGVTVNSAEEEAALAPKQEAPASDDDKTSE